MRQLNRISTIAVLSQLLFIGVLVAAFVFSQGAWHLMIFLNFWVIFAVYGGTLLLTKIYLSLSKSNASQAIPFARDCALVLGALTSLAAMLTMIFYGALDGFRLSAVVSQSLTGLFHGLLVSAVLLAPFETQFETQPLSRLLQRLVVGLSFVVIVGVYVLFQKALTPSFDWGEGQDDSLPQTEAFIGVELPAPVGSLSGLGPEDFTLTSRENLLLGTTIFTSDSTPIVILSSGTFADGSWYGVRPLSDTKLVPGDWIYSGPRDPRTIVTEVTLETTGCFGSCPIYSLTFRRDGSVRYDGKDYVDRKGTVHGEISKADFLRLELLLFKNGYFQLSRNYEVPVTDMSSVITSAVVGGRRKKVRNYANSGPFGLWVVESAIEGMAKRSGIKI